MNKLTHLMCVPCGGGEPTITDDEMADFMPQLPECSLVEEDDKQRLRRPFQFDNFAQALAFSNQVGALAEKKIITQQS